MQTKTISLAILAALVAAAALLWLREPDPAPFEPVAVSLPAKLSAVAKDGQILFEENCAQCHGDRGGGTPEGPPFVHDIYNPGHHSDAAFLLAVRNGVRAHHWPFGNMPPQPQVSDPEVEAITAYVRALQEENGIVSRAHRM